MDLSTKKELLKKLILELEQDLEKAQIVAKDSRDAAINEESKPENEYDTRAIEASYLAGAQAHRVRDLEAQIQILRLTEPRLFKKDSAIDATALVHVLQDDEESWFFMLPQGGGKVIKWESKVISILTPQSPLAQEILGLKVGDTAFLQKKDRLVEVEILAIS
jgi:transcription elongation GreA/GreB family factor